MKHTVSQLIEDYERRRKTAQSMLYNYEETSNLDYVRIERLKTKASLYRQIETELKHVSPWISVDDRLPEVGQSVLCYRPYAVNSGDRPVKIDKYEGWLNADFEGREHGFYSTCKPTHWMPLPEPPKAK